MECQVCGSSDNVEERTAPALNGSRVKFGSYCDSCWRLIDGKEPLKFVGKETKPTVTQKEE